MLASCDGLCSVCVCVCVCVVCVRACMRARAWMTVFLQRRGIEKEEENIKKLISAVLNASHWTGSRSSEWRTKQIGDLWSYSAFHLPLWVFHSFHGIFDEKGMIFMDCCNNCYFSVSIACTLNVGNCIVCWNVGRTLTYDTVQTQTPLLYFRDWLQKLKTKVQKFDWWEECGAPASISMTALAVCEKYQSSKLNSADYRHFGFYMSEMVWTQSSCFW